MTLNRRWILTADGKRATLFSLAMTPEGELNAESRLTLEWHPTVEHEHHRPSILGGRANGMRHFASHGHDDEEAMRRFTREVITWIGGFEDELEIAQLDVFGPSRFLGLLRIQLEGHPHRLRTRVDLHQCELAGLGAEQLAKHPTVRRLLGEEASNRPPARMRVGRR